MYQVSFYVEPDYKDRVKDAVFKAGAGAIGNYELCCFEVEGQGQFRPMIGSNPHIGTISKLEIVQETKIEFVCEDHLIKKVIKALVLAHPYESPAYNIIKLEEVEF